MPPKTLRRRTHAVAQLEKKDDLIQPQRVRSYESDKEMVAAAPEPPRQFSNGVWANDRYMRRKNREYLNEVKAAQEAIEAEQMSIQERAEMISKKDKRVILSRDLEIGGKFPGKVSVINEEVVIRKEAMGKQQQEAIESKVETEERSILPELVTPDTNVVGQGLEKDFTSDTFSNVKTTSGLIADMSTCIGSMHSPIEQNMHPRSEIDPTLDKSAPPVILAMKPTKSVARGIAQSSSSASTRKRMISFSPERAPRPQNRALALKKLEKNIKTNEKLQQRLKAPTLQTPVPSQCSPAQACRPMSYTCPQVRRPMTFTSPQARRAMRFPSQSTTFTSPPSQRPFFQSPLTAASVSFPTSQTEDLDYALRQDDIKDESYPYVVLAESNTDASIVVDESNDVDVDHNSAGEEGGAAKKSQNELLLSQESNNVADCYVDKLAPLSQESCSIAVSYTETPARAAHVDTTSRAFTSKSVIGDVGLFNCEADVEYTGGVYGEGTDGKVTAAVINGQKIALKRAKPHEGLPEHEAKHRAALELHYLRRVRHMKGFLQCLGLCDAIEHTCIALEVMDCKLSDYLRRYGVNSGGSKHRRYTLSFDDTKAMLKKICLPMMTLHDDINVAHGDLACRNILMRTPPEGYEKSWEPDIKLSDFGRIKLPSDEPKILDSSFSFHKNCDVGAFGREILYRLLVGEIVPKEHMEIRSLHKLLQDVTVTQIPKAAETRLGPYYALFMRCTAWGVRPTFCEIYKHLDDLEYFKSSENGLFPLKPTGIPDPTFMSPIAETSRYKALTSSSSRATARDTPTGHPHRSVGSKSRLLGSKNVAEVIVPGLSKPVNWLKTRSVGVQRNAAPQALTPIAHPMLLTKKRKTPPSAGGGAGASRRSLQILNQIQHRTIEKGRKSK
ncbi:hypothetical protein CCR75_003691 [Bremia lactucae]|uniref:Protein kinase domain-containing protein n=1 Tax=Bremia lactucae TaxID=4779 RepID=A0A976II92_BRELC|nr:hypothetical protein CCR75_003691 [Bremia lactucae]